MPIANPSHSYSFPPVPSTPILLFDIETDGLLEKASVIHCICAMSLPDGRRYSFGPGEIEKGLELLAKAPLLCAHNGICFDLAVIRKLYPRIITNRLFDTLTASRLIWTNLYELDCIAARKGRAMGKLTGSHSLEAWGLRLGEYKGDFGKTSDWSAWSKEMQEYCEQDVEVLAKLYQHILKQDYSHEALLLEHDFQEIIFRQEQAGVLFDRTSGEALYIELCSKREACKRTLAQAFPDKVREETFIPKVNNKTRGYVKGVPVIKRELIPFNPSSRQMIAERLTEKYNWTPAEFTETGEPKVDEEVLQSLPYPECSVLIEYLELVKVIGMLGEGNNAWLKLVAPDNRVYGRVITNGAVSGRCTHSRPNLAQIPAHGTYGKECRSLFVAPQGKVMVGADASGLELRMLASFLARYDGGRYIRELLEGDIHSANQKAAGLPTRDNAKRFIYAFLYGAGDQKLGEITCPEASAETQRKTGAKLKRRFLAATPAIRQLTDAIAETVNARPYLYGLDRRLLHVRSKHSALNLLLQSAGAIVMKKATVIFHSLARERYGWMQNNAYEQVIHCHDEVECICTPDKAETIGKLFVESITLAGEYFNLKCPLTGEYKIGKNWNETH